MKKIVLLSSILFLTAAITAQELHVHEFIGRSMKDVISKFGKPAHHDRSNPSMECVFYKTKTFQMVFVANKEGVFQAEGTKCFNSRSSAEKEISKLLKDSMGTGYSVDTLNVAEFELRKSGIKFNLLLFENNYSKKYEIKVKANHSAG
ncbi:MAG: hypothetical protein JW995_11655 [Melioribacteraceae bacterium]|nr:hypothetical protein [Melioribacteraceae bacterium]